VPTPPRATQAWTRDPGQLAALCDAASGCAGFNSNGWMKSDVSRRVASPGTTLWVKQGGSELRQWARNEAGVAAVEKAARSSQHGGVVAPETAAAASKPRPRGPQPPGPRRFRLHASDSESK